MGSFYFPVRILTGQGCLAGLAEEVSRIGAKRPLLVTDLNIIQAGIVDNAVSSLKRQKIFFKVFDGVEPDPEIRHAIHAAEAIQKGNHDLLIAVGGGSVMDAAKAAAILAVNDQDLRELQGPCDAYPSVPLPFITVPTTAGSGSEVSSAAVVVDPEKQIKMYFKCPQLFSRTAFLDAHAATGIPGHIAAASGADTLTHALESFFNPNRTFITEAMSLRAVGIVFSNLREFVRNTRDCLRAQNMLHASTLAGMAMTTAGLGLVHALAHTTGVKGRISHGLACAMLLGPVLRFNRPAVSERFLNLAPCMNCNTPAGRAGYVDLDEQVIQSVEKLLADIGIPKRLSDIGVALDDVAEMVSEAHGSFLSQVNPRTVSSADIGQILRCIL